MIHLWNEGLLVAVRPSAIRYTILYAMLYAIGLYALIRHAVSLYGYPHPVTSIYRYTFRNSSSG